jgi:hypothetical protein
LRLRCPQNEQLAHLKPEDCQRKLLGKQRPQPLVPGILIRPTMPVHPDRRAGNRNSKLQDVELPQREKIGRRNAEALFPRMTAGF